MNQDCNTTYHFAEEAIPDSYRLSEPIRGTVIWDGREVTVVSRLHRWGIHADFNILNDELAARGLLNRGRVGDADSMLVQARGFLGLAAAKLATNTRYFLQGS